jgi:2-phosphosulfolactate phosphatase
MKVNILEFVEGAQRATGLTVIIDVFRAFSVACYAFDAGAKRLIATGSADEAFLLKNKISNSVLVGERDEKKINGFDLGNSPTEIIKTDLSNKTVIHTTTAGTNGLLKAINADILLAGSLVNAGAIIRYIKVLNPENVSLVAMGYRAIESAEEDLLCAEIIADGLSNKKNNYTKRISDLLKTSGKRFFIPENIDFSPPTDFFLCTSMDKFNFVLQALTLDDGNISLLKIEIE